MCGITGAIGGNPTNTSIRASLDELHHRGPDGMALWADRDGSAVLGHSRLTIIDLTDGSAQPFVDPRGRFILTYNGEIYNYIELRQELQSEWDFQTTGDTEVLMAALSVWGHNCLQRLNGMFAFALWDRREQTLFAARDRLGEKPFYFHHDPQRGQFCFASEIRALTKYGVRGHLDEEAMMSYLAASTVSTFDSAPSTLLRGITQLMPGEALLTSVGAAGRVETPPAVWTYWDPAEFMHKSDAPIDASVAASILRELLEDSVRLRLRADVPSGSCLSGGLDSSAVVGLIRSAQPTMAINTFTGRFTDPAFDEGPEARVMRDLVGATGRERVIEPDGFVREAAVVYRAAELPIGSMSQYAQFKVFELVADSGVRVLLDGQGSDEVFCGYGASLHLAYLRGLVANREFGLAIRELRHLRESDPQAFGSVPLGKHLVAATVPERLASRRLNPLLTAHGSELLEHTDHATSGPFRGRNALSSLATMLTSKTMLPSLLRYGDRLSMRNSVEVRLPFCDHRVVEFGLGLHGSLMLGGGSNKLVLREAMRDVVPDEVRSRKKRGFNPPEHQWISGPVQAWIAEMVSSSAAVRQLVDGKAFEEELARCRSGQGRSSVIWRVANLAAWDNYNSDLRVD